MGIDPFYFITLWYPAVEANLGPYQTSLIDLICEDTWRFLALNYSRKLSSIIDIWQIIKYASTLQSNEENRNIVLKRNLTSSSGPYLKLISAQCCITHRNQWFGLQIKWLVFMWNATQGWNGLNFINSISPHSTYQFKVNNKGTKGTFTEVLWGFIV